jgi:membrane-associated protease RseP (regulator of RpoE activity)
LSQAAPAGQSLSLEGNSIIYLFMKYLAFGQLLPAPVNFGSTGPFLYWIRYFFTGLPFPAGGTDVMLHSVAWAGWAGLLVTALNLIPAGQLDGGHALYVLLGKEKMKKLYPVLLVILVGLGFVWSGWWFWAAILLVFGRFYAEPADQITELDTKRKALAVFALIVFILVFVPVPLTFPG